MKIPQTPAFARYCICGIVLIAVLGGCNTASLSSSQRLKTDLVSTEYGKTRSEYVNRPAFVSLDTMTNGANALNITLNVYGRHLRSILFYAKDKEALLDAVDTYLEWEANASASGEIVRKRIKTVKVPDSTPIYFSFHSETETAHFLTIGYLETGKQKTAEFPFLVFDRANAEKFRNLLLQLPDSRSR